MCDFMLDYQLENLEASSGGGGPEWAMCGMRICLPEGYSDGGGTTEYPWEGPSFLGEVFFSFFSFVSGSSTLGRSS
jgi:hypothetical protein